MSTSTAKPTRRTSPRKSSKETTPSQTSETPSDARQSTVPIAEAICATTKKNKAGEKKTSTGGSKKGGEVKCHYKQCGIVMMEELEECANVGCKKKIHPTCMEVMYERLAWYDEKEMADIGVVCSKTCYNKYMAAASRKPNWGNDGAKGPNDPKSSERILLDWLLAEGNYANKWRGKEAKGKKKKHIAAEIAALINAAKVKVVRDGKQVMNKIAHIEKSFRLAHDFANTETGQGLQENNWGEFDDAVRRKCPYYFDLVDIFGDRASAKPKATSHDNLDSSEEEDEEELSQDLDLFSVGSVNDDDSGGDIHMDISKYDVDNDEEVEDEEKELGEVEQPVGKKTDGKSSKQVQKTSRQKRKNASSESLIGRAASSKTNNAQVTLFDPATSGSLATLAASQQKVAESKLAASAAMAEQTDMELRMKKLQTLMDIREKNPSLTDEQIIQLFPMLADFVKILK